MRRPTILAALVATTVAGCGSSVARAPSGTTTEAAAVVPWTPLPPTHPVIPSRRIPPRPDPGLAAAAPACRGGDLEMGPGRTGAAAGTEVATLVFTLRRGHPACSVRGRPHLTVTTTDGVTVGARLEQWGITWHSPVLLSAHSSVDVRVTWPSVCFLDTRRHSVVRVGYDDSSWTAPVGSISSTCAFGGPRRPLSSVGETPFLPSDPRPARTVTAYDHVQVRGPHVLSARLGQPIRFVVALVARRRVVLDPCPDFWMGASPGQGRHYGLDCAAVRWRDDRGRPFLPAGTPVRFAMRLSGTDAPIDKFWWGIVAPGTPAELGGVVRGR